MSNEPIQALENNSGVGQYRSFTELGRQVARSLDFSINLYTSELFDEENQLISSSLELASLAMIDLGWILKTQASPFINWNAIGTDSTAAANDLRNQIKTYAGKHWQELASDRVI